MQELPQLSDSDEESEDGYYFITSRPAPGGDIYQASRVGDLGRVRCGVALRIGPASPARTSRDHAHQFAIIATNLLRKPCSQQVGVAAAHFTVLQIRRFSGQIICTCI